MDSILINVPVNSPLHPQANLPLLKGYLKSHDFDVKIIDTNILFFYYFLGLKDGSEFRLSIEECFENPINILSFYSNIEKKLWEKNKGFEGLDVGLRYLNMKYDRTKFDDVLKAIEDIRANPFIEFYKSLIETHIKGTHAKIVGIAITFQDQIIAAFTLADLLRKYLPSVKIVMGGQMVTRCYDTMMKHQGLSRYYDYLALWEGEKTLLDLHRKIIRNEEVEMVNIIDIKETEHKINRQINAPKSD